MRASQLDDPIYDPDDPLLLQAEPMRPIRATYVTHPSERRVQTDLLEQLGLVHVSVGQNLFYLNQADSLTLRVQANDSLIVDRGFTTCNEPDYEPTDAEIRAKAEAILLELVREQAATRYTRSALHTPVSVEVQRFAQEQRAIADAELLAHGVDMKARIAHAVAESEAA